MKVRVSILLGIFTAVGSLAFGQAFDARAFKATYDLAMTSDIETLSRAVKTLDAVLARDPSNPEATIYKGSLIAKIADLEFWFWDKLAHANQGIALMAEGMSKLDGDAGESVTEDRKLVMYMVRGITLAYMPAMFRQSTVATRELERSRADRLFPDVEPGSTCRVARVVVQAVSTIRGHCVCPPSARGSHVCGSPKSKESAFKVNGSSSWSRHASSQRLNVGYWKDLTYPIR